MTKKKQYHLLQLSEIKERYHNTPLPIKGSTKLHMICFHANGSVQAKVNLCSCSICLVGDFVKCPYEKGSMVLVGDHEYDLSSGDESSGDEFEKDDLSEDDDDTEQYEVRGDSVFGAIKKGTSLHCTLMQMQWNCFTCVRFWILEQQMKICATNSIMSS